MVSFVNYVLQFKDEYSALGDIASDIERDPAVKRSWGYKKLIEYLDTMNAVDRIYGILEEARVSYLLSRG
jgi:hypothetical protein